jgi:ABC-type dipeptide/oligopeptide/nickel transport system ATPase component
MLPLLKIDNLCVQQKGANGRPVDILRNFNLAIAPAETLALVGESGCGKSTAALSILRLINWPGRISSGRILFDGQDLLAMPEKRLRRIRWKEIALIFQEPASCLNPLVRIGAQIVEPLRLHLQLDRRRAKKRTLELLEMVGLENPERCFSAYPFEISSGMRQRALIAMALACKPRLLIADEPTTAVDPIHQREIVNLLLGMKAEFGLTLLFISHDLELAAQFADVIAVMQNGRIAESGPADQILRFPQQQQTRRLVAAAVGSGEPVSNPGVMQKSALRGKERNVTSQPISVQG